MRGGMHPVARRYARALFEEARAQALAPAIDADLQQLSELLTASRELARIFESPVIPRDKKQKILERLLAGRVHPLTWRFLMLLIAKEREHLLPDVVRAYQVLQDEAQGIVEAHVRTAFPLDEAGAAPLQERLERLTGKRVRLRLTYDPGLIGGLVVRIGDTVYDGSVRHQLAILRERLRRNTIAFNGKSNVSP
ncbi:ATP synthase subunit delta [bacterium HR18]|nr:ATP synthase subunit delta [bacterium HR18]